MLISLLMAYYAVRPPKAIVRAHRKRQKQLKLAKKGVPQRPRVPRLPTRF